MKRTNKKRLTYALILINILFYCYSLPLWICQNKESHPYFLESLLIENISKTSFYIYADSLKTTCFSGVYISSDSKPNWFVETADYKVNVKYTNEYPRWSPVNRIMESQVSYLLMRKEFFLNVLQRFMVESVNKEYNISSSDIAVRLEHFPNHFIAPETEITFTYPEKRDSVLASYCYIDSSSVTFDYQKANVASDTLKIGSHGQGRLIAYAHIPPYKIVTSEMHKELYELLLLYAILSGASIIVFLFLWLQRTKMSKEEVEKRMFAKEADEGSNSQVFISVYEGLGVKSDSSCIYYKEKEVKCRKMVFTLLMHLIDSPNHFITKEEFKELFWKDGVMDAYLNKSIHNLIYEAKHVLKDLPFEINVIRGRGYKLEKVLYTEEIQQVLTTTSNSHL